MKYLVKYLVKNFGFEFSLNLYVFGSPVTKRVIFEYWSVRMYACVLLFMHLCMCLKYEVIILCLIPSYIRKIETLTFIDSA